MRVCQRPHSRNEIGPGPLMDRASAACRQGHRDADTQRRGRGLIEKLQGALLGHPAGPCEVALHRRQSTLGLVVGLDTQDDAGHLQGIGAVFLRVEKPEVGDEMLLVTCSL